MSAVRDDPALVFWLRAVGQEGALSETDGDSTLVVLPPVLQAALGLPEELAVTAEPEVAREDGALLLAAGHPALDSMAARVLTRGEAGRGWLTWPRSEPPRTPSLLERIRDRFPVDHGRIDAAGPIELCYAPVVRVTALVTYTASLDLRFQEREEVVVDGVTGSALDEATVRALARQPPAARPHVRHRTLDPDLPKAIAGADALLRARASERKRVLAAEAAAARRDELARLDAYYDGVLAMIARRRARADDERRRLLDDQAAVTTTERERRRRELDEQFRPTTELRPVRLHLLEVPAARLAVRIRRGSHTHPFAFTWLLPAQVFAPVRCPTCGADEQLAAGRKRLGCTACQPRPAGRGTPVSPAPTPAQARRSVADPDEQAARRATAPKPGTNPTAKSASPTGPTPERPAKAAPSRAPRRARPAPAPARKVVAAGDRLGVDFWQTVACEQRWPRKRLVADGPLQTVYRLWGAVGPALAVGLPTRPVQVTAVTAPPQPGIPHATTGVVVTDGGATLPYTLFWELAGGKPRLFEVVPFPTVRTPALPPLSRADPAAVDGLSGDVPAPRGPDDPVTAQLWRVEPAVAGLPATIRCITAWWRAGWQDDGTTPEVLAAALASVLSPWAGRRRSRAAAAGDHDADPAAVTRTARALQSRLAPSWQRPW